MKILLIIETRNEIFPLKWYKGLTGLGNEVKILSLFDVDYLPEGTIIKIESKCPGHRLKMLLNIKRIREQVEEYNPDIVHAIEITRQGFLGSLIDFHPFISTAIGSDIFVFPDKSIIEKYIVEYCFKKADIITSMAEHMTEYIKEKFSFDKKKIFTFPWGCDTEVFYTTNQINSNAAQQQPVVICTRRMDNPIYNQELLIYAIPDIIKKNKNCRFIFTGDGYLKKKYETLVSELDVTKYTEFLGWQKMENIAELLRSSMIFVSPAKSDGNNISLNEAMACGCFPIASDIPANRQWIIDGNNGYLVEAYKPEILAEKIIYAIENTELRRRASEINKMIIEERGDWNKQLLKINRIYSELVSKK